VLSFVLTLLATILVSFLPERWLKPEAPARPDLKSLRLQISLVSMVFIALTLIVQRAVFSGIAIFVFLIILVAVNNAKYKALREPMVFSDFAMFSQAFKHPRLYFPFLGLVPVILAPLLIIALIITVLKLEPALPFSWQRIAPSIGLLLGLYISARQQALAMQITMKPAEDIHQYGLQNSLFIYAVQAFSDKHRQKIKKALAQSPLFTDNNPSPPFLHTFLSASENKPNITVIQSESFFDARRLHPSIKKQVLQSFDKICAESLQYGQLKVPAWGANTMRSEFAFLSGIKNKKLQLFRFYPYQFLNKYPVTSIASLLQSLGYYCVCIHPHPASFFGRERLFPRLGFDEFIDIEDFADAQKFGPYISDQSVSEKILQITHKYSDRPLFIFSITMENHGPLHLEKTSPAEQHDYLEDYPKSANLEKINDLTVYLRHLKNADNMLKQLTDAFRHTDKKHVLCFYGDHIPSMPEVYEETKYDNHDSDYIIWTNSKSQDTQQHTITIENLAQTLLEPVCKFMDEENNN